MEAPLLLLSLSPFLVFAHCKILAATKMASRSRFILCLLTAPNVLLCLSLLLGTWQDVKSVSTVGGATKEMGQAAVIKLVSPECMSQWVKDESDRMKADLTTYLIVLVCFCLLYRSRLVTDASFHCDSSSGGVVTTESS
jgi:hypothetical protein